MNKCVLLNYAALDKLLKEVAYFNVTCERDDEAYLKEVYANFGRMAVSLLDMDESLKLIVK